MDKKRCPICGRRFEDILKHFVLVHDVRDMNQLSQIANEAKMKESIKKAFSDYVEELKKKMGDGKISIEDYRELVMKWCKNHEM